MTTGKSKRGRGKRRRARSCTGKRPYTEQAAKVAARVLSQKTGGRFRAYKCKFCHLDDHQCAWHVGHAQTLSTRLR